MAEVTGEAHNIRRLREIEEGCPQLLRSLPYMTNLKRYIFEYVLLVSAVVLSVTGFWNIFFSPEASPTPYHFFHVITVFVWLILLLLQLNLIGKKQFLSHKRVGLLILFFGPLLVATTAVMTIHSANKGVISGKGDPLFVQNVMGTFELAILILLAFVVRKRRALHGAFLLSTVLAFVGVALFFTLLGFVPQFKIEGPETFYRFAYAAITGLVLRFIIGMLFFLKDRRNNWPLLVTGMLPASSIAIGAILESYGLIQPATAFVGSFNEIITFGGTFIVLLIALLLTGILDKKRVDLQGQNSAERFASTGI